MPAVPHQLGIAMLAALLLYAPMRAVQSQPLHDVFLRRGDRVRLNFTTDMGAAPVASVTGVFDRAESGAVIVGMADGTLLTAPLARVRRLEVSNGRQPLTRQGMTVGLIAGSVIGAVVGLSGEPNEYFPRPVYAAAGAVVLGLAGGLAGGVLGSVLRMESWSDVPTRIPLRRSRPAAYHSSPTLALHVRVSF